MKRENQIIGIKILEVDLKLNSSKKADSRIPVEMKYETRWSCY